MEKVMSKIGKVATKTCRCAAEGAGRIAREIRLKNQMAENKEQIREIYEIIGKNVYEKYLLKETLDVETDFSEDCAIIEVLANENSEIRMELLKLKDLKQCSTCHYEIELDYHFCPNCGKEQELSKECKKNDGPATIETTDEIDKTLKRKEYGEYNIEGKEGRHNIENEYNVQNLESENIAQNIENED